MKYLKLYEQFRIILEDVDGILKINHRENMMLL
jgi:hypothetical protein